MSWIVIGLLGVLATAGAWIFLGSNAFGRNCPRDDLCHFINSLLILMENGGRLHMKQRGSDVVMDFIRLEGEGGGATIVLRVPRAAWSLPHSSPLYDRLASEGADVEVMDSASPILLETRIPVGDIWTDWAGSRAAHIGRLTLDILGVPREARFNFSLVGKRSRRGLHYERELREG